MDLTNLQVATRSASGKGPARTLRREGRLPAVLYGPGNEPVMLSIDVVDFEQAVKGQMINKLILSLNIDDGKQKNPAVMIKELQAHPVSGSLIHVDFYEISMDRKIRVMVPVTTVGVSEGVELGGTLQIIRRELEVFCLPTEIPESIEIDITGLAMGDSIHVEEIPTSGNVEVAADVNFTVLTVLSPRMEEEEVVDEEEEGEGEEGEAGEEAAEEGGEEA